jgi:hypothetical protein
LRSADCQPVLPETSLADAFQYSCRHITPTRQSPKTYGRFSSTIFFATFRELQVPDHQWAGKAKNLKKSKKLKIKWFFGESASAFFCQNAQ